MSGEAEIIMLCIVGCIGLCSLYSLYYKWSTTVHPTGPPGWRMCEGQILKRERCSQCRMTFPDMKATTNLTMIPY